MRMERLAPAVMLVIFDDIPDRMEIEEPRQGIQFGVRAARNAEPAGSWWVEVRDPATGVEAGRRAQGAGAVPRGLGRRAAPDRAAPPADRQPRAGRRTDA